MPNTFNPDDDTAGEVAIASPARPARRRAWILWVTSALVVATALAAVIIGGTTSATGADVMPGINEPTAQLLQLDSTDDKNLNAPPFTLTDQNGRPMSLSDYRGKAVVLTFNDDQCADLCTLLAQDVLAADRALGAAQSKVAFVSVNANPYYPTGATVKQWTDQHGLGHTANWHYGTAAPAMLSALARKYGVPIQLDPADKSVEHGTQIFFIDPDGHEARLGQFGTESANTASFGHAMAQVADDLLPAAQRTHVAGSDITAPTTGSTQLNALPAPIDLPTLGRPSSRYSTFTDRGSYTVVNFWASTCAACTTETAALESEFHTLAGKVAFVGIDVADQTNAGTAFARSYHVTYPLLTDEKGAAAGRYQISGLPYTVILGPSGKVLIRHPGAITQEQLDYLLRSLDRKLPPAG